MKLLASDCRVAFRRILPPIQMAALVMFWMVGSEQERACYGAFDAAEEARTERLQRILDEQRDAATVELDPRRFLHSWISPWKEAVIAVHWPVLLVAAPVLAVFVAILPAGTKVPAGIGLSLLAALAGAFWFLVGGIVDRYVGLDRGTGRPAWTSRHRSTEWFKLIALMALAGAAYFWSPKYPPGMHLISMSLIFWGSFGAFIQALRIWLSHRARVSEGDLPAQT